MTTFGNTLFSELNGPRALVDQAVASEQAGFDFLVMSDHFHPWLSSHTDSPFAWTVFGAVAERTRRVELMSYVTCPFLRYHPAIVAQAAATVQLLSDGRFTLGLGSGERLNEHVVGRGWPAVDVRHEMLTESIEAIRELFGGEMVTYRGRHITVEDARLFSLPATPPPIAVAGSGPRSIALAVDLGDAFISTEPDADMVADYRNRAGERARTIGQVPLSYDPDPGKAAEHAQRFAFGIHGWKVMSELPNVVNFDAAAATVRDEDLAEVAGIGADADALVEAVMTFVEAGYDEVCVVQVGDDKGGFFRIWSDEMAPRLEKAAG
ncbi:MAG TPA: TIGR03557 family F420-dependent LLM class oxidoreductase [Euzebyales bacterium]|nr:TIGR03557 family F420-dependent LLM class oxidoreductase [Euzebyales bacterium]